MAKRKKSLRKPEKGLGRFRRKNRRGRKGVSPSLVWNRGEHYRALLEQYWDVVGEALLGAKRAEDVVRTFEQTPEYVRKDFSTDLAPLILEVLREPTFPTQQRGAQIKFLAYSLAARGVVSPRRSRDICAQQRRKPRHYIIRQDSYIECTCGYKGHAVHGACRKCGTDIVDWKAREVLRGMFPQ